MYLASVERILDINPIEGADKIVLATVLGWQVIVKKEEYKIGDLCIYIPIDTLVDPTKSYFSFLADSKNPTMLARIKTIKLKGKWSQGLVIPFNVLNQIDSNQVYSEGQDVGELLGIKKYEKENVIFATGITTYNKPFPTEIIPITDEDNLKTKFKVIEELKGKKLCITQKMDGSSMTLIKLNDSFMVCSRRLVVEEGSVMYQYVLQEKLKERIENLGLNIAIQGEFCGPKINCNQLGLKNYNYYIFNARNLDTNKYLDYYQLDELCKKLKIDMVPFINFVEPEENISLNYFQEIANKQLYTHPNNKTVPAEGIVIRPIDITFSNELGKNLSVKVINQNYSF